MPNFLPNNWVKDLGILTNVLAAQSCPPLCDPMDCSPLAPVSTEFSRQEYWSGLPFPIPGDLPNPGIEPRFLTLQADYLLTKPPGKGKLLYLILS